MFIIPMAGLSSRFFKVGYTKPKYQLVLGDETIFSWSVRSFEQYFQTDKFVFIYRDIYETENFLKIEIEKLNIVDFELVCLPEETLGQADTVYQGINHLPDDEIYIFNIDSKIIKFKKPDWVAECDGYLEVFKGEGDHWSFVLPAIDDSRMVLKTTEKERISDLCSSGLYYFKRKSDFENLFLNAKQNKFTVKNEYYIAPLYNQMIANNKIIFCNPVDKSQILFCGTPDEYHTLLKNFT